MAGSVTSPESTTLEARSDGGEHLAEESRTLAARIRRPEVHQSYVIPVLSKAITIIRLLETTDERLNVNEIARRTGIAKTTTYRILRTLSAHGYLPYGAEGIYSFKYTTRQPTRQTVGVLW